MKRRRLTLRDKAALLVAARSADAALLHGQRDRCLGCILSGSYRIARLRPLIQTFVKTEAEAHRRITAPAARILARLDEQVGGRS